MAVSFLSIQQGISYITETKVQRMPVRYHTSSLHYVSLPVGSDSEARLDLTLHEQLEIRVLSKHPAPTPTQSPVWLTPHRLTGGWSILCWLTSFQGTALTAWDCSGWIKAEKCPLLWHVRTVGDWEGLLRWHYCGRIKPWGQICCFSADFVHWELHKASKGRAGPALQEEQPQKMVWGKDDFHTWGLPELSTLKVKSKQKCIQTCWMILVTIIPDSCGVNDSMDTFFSVWQSFPWLTFGNKSFVLSFSVSVLVWLRFLWESLRFSFISLAMFHLFPCPLLIFLDRFHFPNRCLSFLKATSTYSRLLLTFFLFFSFSLAFLHSFLCKFLWMFFSFVLKRYFLNWSL